MDGWMGDGWDGSPGGRRYRAPYGANNWYAIWRSFLYQNMLICSVFNKWLLCKRRGFPSQEMLSFCLTLGDGRAVTNVTRHFHPLSTQTFKDPK